MSYEAFIDVGQVFFWTTTRKNKAIVATRRGVTERDITEILRLCLVNDHNLKKTEQRLLALPYVQRYCSHLSHASKKADFLHHLRMYIETWRTDTNWQITTTNRFKADTVEGNVTARESMKAGSTISHLTGTMVRLSSDEVEKMGEAQTDFSLVAMRYGQEHFFLGPARFLNHDCQPNARLVLHEKEQKVSVKAIKDISPGDDITVSYGNDYFDDENIHCLCQTCKGMGRNGWKLSSSSSSSASMKTNAATNTSQVKKRSLPMDDKDEASDFKAGGPSRKKAKTGYVKGKKSHIPSRVAKQIEAIPSNFNQARTSTATPLDSGATTDEMIRTFVLQQMQTPGFLSDIMRLCGAHKPGNGAPNPRTTADRTARGVLGGDHADSEAAGIEVPPSPATPSVNHPNRSASTPERRPVQKDRVKQVITNMIYSWPSPPGPAVDISAGANSKAGKKARAADRRGPSHGMFSNFSSLWRSPLEPVVEDFEPSGSNEATNMTSEETCAAGMIEDPNATRTTAAVGPQNMDDQASAIENDQQGEYNTSLPNNGLDHAAEESISSQLQGSTLPERDRGEHDQDVKRYGPDARKVQCLTCRKIWVQAEGHLTRRECPPCERHIKLYGLRWPLTDPLPTQEAAERDSIYVRRKRHYNRRVIAFEEPGEQSRPITNETQKGSGIWKTWSATKDDPTERIMDLKLIDPVMTREEEAREKKRAKSGEANVRDDSEEDEDDTRRRETRQRQSTKKAAQSAYAKNPF